MYLPKKRPDHDGGRIDAVQAEPAAMFDENPLDAFCREDVRERQPVARQKGIHNGLKTAAVTSGRIWYMRGHEKTLLGREHLVTQDNGQNGTYALRVGDWKLHRYDRKTARNVVVETKLADTQVPEFQLFNLAEDPAEKTNVIDQHTTLAARLRTRLAGIVDAGRSRP